MGSLCLGSEDQAISWRDGRAVAGPAGGRHAVDLDSGLNSRAAEVAYAICGTPVLLWRNERFVQSRAEVHQECARRAAG